MNSQKDKIVKFLEENISFFFDHICLEYPLSENIIEKHKDQLDWELLSCNEHLKWSAELIGKFENYWDWGSLSGNESLPWSDELITKYADKWYWKKDNACDFCLADNDSVKWSFNILEKYPERIDWNMISTRTDILNENQTILNDFADKLCWDVISGNEEINFSEELIDKLESYWNWEYLSGNRAIHWTEKLRIKYKYRFSFDRYKEGNNELFLNIKYSRNLKKKPNTTHSVEVNNSNKKYTEKELAEVLKNPDWHKLSYENRMQWSTYLIDRYKEYWDWKYLSLNSGLPWSVELIDKFKDKWEWGHEETEPNGKLIGISGLTSNSSIPWSHELIGKFKEKWHWRDLSWSPFIPWSLEILYEFYDRWDWDVLVSNKALWGRVFYQYLDNLSIRKLMSLNKTTG